MDVSKLGTLSATTVLHHEHINTLGQVSDLTEATLKPVPLWPNMHDTEQNPGRENGWGLFTQAVARGPDGRFGYPLCMKVFGQVVYLPARKNATTVQVHDRSSKNFGRGSIS
ncbi:MAG: hypothetical protein M0021_10555 [Clostridia bacterium]|nr:hypothetical protein [Clostridia bacterium]